MRYFSAVKAKPTLNDPAERVRASVTRWLDTTGAGQREFATKLGRTQVWLQKVLAGKNHVRLRDLDVVAAAMHTTASDLVKVEDERYMVELTPTELRLIERLRHRPERLDGLTQLLDLREPLSKTGDKDRKSKRKEA